MTTTRIAIDGRALKMYLEDTKKSMQSLSQDMGCGLGYMFHAIITNSMGKPQYMLMCRILGIDEERFKAKPEDNLCKVVAGDSVARQESPEGSSIEILEMLRRIEKDIARLGQIMLDIRELLKKEGN